MRIIVFWCACLSVFFSLIRLNNGYKYEGSNCKGLNRKTRDLPCDKYEFSENHFACRCNSTYCDTINPVSKPPKGKYVMYTSSLTKRFYRTEGEFNDSSKNQTGFTFKIDKAKKNQKLFGFGGAFTDSAGINILSLPEKAQELLLRSYFSTEGIEYNFARVPIGGCDFSTHPYELDDKPGDVDLKYFSLTEEDYKYKIPLIQRALNMTKRQIHLFATSWSSPPWMKTNDNITGSGFLKKEYYELFAQYHVKFFEEYKKAGLTFWAVTTGNEPSDGLMPSVIKFNSMAWYPNLQAKWIAENFGPAIRKSQFSYLKIICLDDQRLLLPGWVDKIMENKEAAEYIDGIGIHWYADKIVSPEVIRKLSNSYPDKFIMNTEACQGASGIGPKVIPGSWERAEGYVEDIMQDLHCSMTGWVEWNLALDMTGGPNWADNFVDSTILVNKEKGEFYKQPIFYALGHFSKFIQPGAVKIDTTPQKYDNFSALTAVNEDGTTIIVIQNRASEVAQVNFEDSEDGQSKTFYLEGRSVNTIIY